MLQNFVKEIFCTFRRQIGEDQDVRFVICVIALDRLSIQKQPLVVVHKLDDIEDAPTSNPLGSEPKCLAFTGPRHVWTHGASAAKILVRSPEESRNPVCDGAKGNKVVVRELPCPIDVLEILQQEEIGGLRRRESSVPGALALRRGGRGRHSFGCADRLNESHGIAFL
jgi:hypothetical protein